ncbi:MAG: metal ABC transporter ATP-binding protein [Deltaproteobacteria bacterium]|nr:metal ABC transporter ATP-binding protein [Deltaproteobacteria bacterium]MDZ4224829.1 metal ABC transporter ATP-binding protein [bacterium]
MILKNFPPIELHDVTVSYHRRPVLWNVDLKIPEGKLIGVIGPNGAGKSTLIKAIMGLLPLSSGWIQVYGKSAKEQRGILGYVPQKESVDWDFPVTVKDVVMMGRYGKIGLIKRASKQDRRIVGACLEKLGISSFADRQISQLSGGQQQRVFLARALAQESEIYLMDEPFVGVDAATESAIILLLKELKNQGKTVLVVNHDLQTAQSYYDDILMLNMRVVVFGPTRQVMTTEWLHKTYGGRLKILTDAAAAVENAQG